MLREKSLLFVIQAFLARFISKAIYSYDGFVREQGEENVEVGVKNVANCKISV